MTACERCGETLNAIQECPNCYGLIDITSDQAVSEVKITIDGVEAILCRGLPSQEQHDAKD